MVERRKYRLYSVPLFKKPGFEALQNNLFGEKRGSSSTACWRGYKAEWIIINDELYLKNILSCNYENDGVKADLKKLFGSAYKNGLLKASWVTDSLVVKHGKYIVEDHSFSDPIYERDIVLFFQKGNFTREKVYDNSKAYESVYERSNQSLRDFLYPKINWDVIPNMGDKTYHVILSFSTTAERKPENFKIQRSVDIEVLNNEALRVISLLPEWSVYFKFGKFIPLEWRLPFTFNEELRKEYDQK